MSSFLTHYWHTLSDHVERARERRFLNEARRAMSACACTSPVDDAGHTREGEASVAERLEYIALFAQAGYFNMGYPVDLFQPPVDLPPSD